MIRNDAESLEVQHSLCPKARMTRRKSKITGLSDNPEEMISIKKKNIQKPKVSDVHFSVDSIINKIVDVIFVDDNDSGINWIGNWCKS